MKVVLLNVFEGLGLPDSFRYHRFLKRPTLIRSGLHSITTTGSLFRGILHTWLHKFPLLFHSERLHLILSFCQGCFSWIQLYSLSYPLRSHPNSWISDNSAYISMVYVTIGNALTL